MVRGGTHDAGKFFCRAQKRRQICGEEGQACVKDRKASCAYLLVSSACAW